MELPVVPFDRAGLRAVEARVEDHAVAIRLRLLALEKRQLVDAVDRAILRHDVGADGGRERREKIYFVHDLVRHAPGGNVPRPADDARRPDAAFEDGVVVAAPRPRRSAPRPPRL